MHTNVISPTSMPFSSSVALASPAKLGATALLLVTVMACSSDNDPQNDPNTADALTQPDGLVSVTSSASATETLGAIETTLNANDAITVVGRVDHQANAEGADLELGPNEVLFFGNPALGTPLMQQNQLTGIDLPQKFLAWENAEGEVQLSYNAASYLQQRHALAADTEQLTSIGNALKGLAEGATGVIIDEDTIVAPSVMAGEGLVVVPSTQAFDQTYAELISAITATGTLSIFSEIDHNANAVNVGLELLPTRLVIFGNPVVGTPIMDSQPSSGIDLPLKALVYEDSEQNVFIAYNDPAYLASRHGVTNQSSLIDTITAAVAGLVATATGAVENANDSSDN